MACRTRRVRTYKLTSSVFYSIRETNALAASSRRGRDTQLSRLVEIETEFERDRQRAADEEANELKRFKRNPGPSIRGSTNRCLLYTSPSPRDQRGSRMPSSA